MAKRKQGFNKYETQGDITIIFMKKYNGEEFQTLIDTEDLQKLIDLDYSWFPAYHKNINGYYAKTSLYQGKESKPKYITKYLHRIVVSDAKLSKQFVNHKNHNTLDNRKFNLEITTNALNSRDRSGSRKNSKSGFRNVSWCNKSEKWIVQLMIDGKNKCLGKFNKEDLHKAAEFAKEMRNTYYIS